jgi:hypothetical protein
MVCCDPHFEPIVEIVGDNAEDWRESEEGFDQFVSHELGDMQNKAANSVHWKGETFASSNYKQETGVEKLKERAYVQEKKNQFELRTTKALRWSHNEARGWKLTKRGRCAWRNPQISIVFDCFSLFHYTVLVSTTNTLCF